MTTPVDDYLQRFSEWCDQASFGDNGEAPSIDLDYDGRRPNGWHAYAYSFYDGSGSGRGHTPLEALEECWTDLQAADGRADREQRERVVHDLAAVLHVPWDKARQRLAMIEGWAKLQEIGKR